MGRPLCGLKNLPIQATPAFGGHMLRGLYDWTLSLAARKSAEWWLALIAFVESSVFLVPADVLFLPMALSRPNRAYRYALVATAASVLGGVAGWFIGHYAYDAVARPILEFYGKFDEFETLRLSSGDGIILLMLVTSGLAHLPPIKVVTILAGVVGFPLGWFIVSAIVARGARFLFLAWLLRRYGEPIREFIEKRLGLIASIAAAILILLYFFVKYAV
jgi:membrane protein YqaA with SNARE-associated domain